MHYRLVKETEKKPNKDETPVYVNSYVLDVLGGKLTDSIGSVGTLYEGLEMAASKYGNVNFLGRITEEEKVSYLTYAETRELSEELAQFICGHAGSAVPMVGICSENRQEWIITEHATYFYSGANCPIYPSFGWSAVKYILEETKMEMLFISQKSMEKIVLGVERDAGASAKAYLPKIFVVFDRDVEKEHLEILEKHGVEVYFFWDVLQKCRDVSEKAEQRRKSKASSSAKAACKSVQGTGSLAKFAVPTPDTVATICYTSGTTGTPKGAMITHRNFVSVSGSFLQLSKDRAFFPLGEENRYLSFLPLAHVFERVVESTLMMSQGTVIYYRGNPKQLQKDFTIARPHYFVGVPRVFNSVKAAIETKARDKGAFISAVFSMSVKICQVFKNRLVREVFGKTVFSSIRKTFGDSVLCMLSGSAPLSAETATFFEAVFNCHFFEGYGQTETTAGNITTEVNTEEKGVIGIPFPCNRVKLVSRPEYNALVEDNRGELLMQGPAMFKGYYKQERLSREVFCEGEGEGEEGEKKEKEKDPYNTQGNKWVKTGDIAEITKEGNLKIIGRCKEIFKLSQGEYIIPEKIENQFSSRKIQYLEDITIVGYSTKDYLLAICTTGSVTDAQKVQIQESIEREGQKLVAAEELIKIEIPKKFIFTTTAASIENGLLTPSGKKIRKKILSHFQREIDSVYA
ncbi:long-chain acyl-CoA synthetase [Nematocida sp. AWRm77]|nr:long-chain acyl-CoA synthetase [Nematocida sp. AWRm77]